VIRPAELIQRKRDGQELGAEELGELVLAYARGDVPDYQLAAFCMAVYFQGLTSAETFALTDAMVRSGDTIDLGAALGRRVVDKHSTGGVGDKTTLVVGPIVAACGVPFGKMSGRGLGHTGGTLDKLESIPGFRVELTTEELIAQVREIGLAIIGQTGDLVPADKKLYALRDVTATVDNVSLIAASIMSKKIASGADAIVLDVKVGDGAFMKSLADAQVLAETMIALGQRADRDVVCVLTDMDQPLGCAVGNALEVREAAAALRGEGPPDLRELALDASAHLLALSDLGIDRAEARRRTEARGRRRVGVCDVRALGARAGRRPGRGGAAEGAPRPRGVRAAGGLRARARCAAGRAGGAPSRRRPAREGRPGRPRGRRRVREEARRRGRGGRAPRGDPRAGRALRRRGGKGRARRVRARRRAATRAVDRARHDRLTRGLCRTRQVPGTGRGSVGRGRRV